MDGFARPPRRREDARLLVGRGRFADDVNLPGQAYACFVRSVHPHGVLNGVDAHAARAAPGVLGVYTIAELRAGGVGDIPYLPMPNFPLPEPKSATRPPLAEGRVRHVGEPVVLVVAETVAQAKDAAELVNLDIEALPVVLDIAEAVRPGAPVLRVDAPDNVGLVWHGGNADATEAAFAVAHHVTRLRLVNNRVIANPMEPRSCIATYDAEAHRYGLIAATQGVQYMMRVLCGHTFAIPREEMHVLTYDVGGAFGVKEQPYGEDVAILHAARDLGRPVKWSGTRGEHLLSDNHARDALIEAALALDADGGFLAVRADILDAMGAYYSVHGPFVTIRNTTNGLPLVYRTPAIEVTVRLVLTNTASTGPYRGAGREQAAYVMERLVDQAARETGRDPVALRRRNLIPPAAMPYRSPAGRVYDSGAFEAVMDQALALADWDGFGARRSASEAAGMLRGRGLCCFLECVGGLPYESADVRPQADGSVLVVVATQSQGQGHETSFAQLVSERLGVGLEQVRLKQGDSADVPRGLATIASRSMLMAGSAIALGCDLVIETAKRLAAELLEAAVADIVFADASCRVVGTDRVVSLAALAERYGTALHETGNFDVDDLNFPNGCHVCEVEIDPETGVTRIARYTAIDDSGVVINPMIVHGQAHGGIAQGIGQALMEQIVYDADGQLLTGSFMDYSMPRATDFPHLEVGLHEVRCTSNPLGVKGAGESGVTGSLAAVMNAVTDALDRANAAPVDMPATPEVIWRALSTKPHH